MPTVNVVGFPSSTKTPGAFLSVVLGGPGTSAGAAPKSQIHFGNMIGSAITVSATSTTIAAGTASLNTVYPVFSAAQSGALFGLGSELHLDAKAAFAEDPAATLYQIATPQGTGQALASITPSGTSTAALTIRLWLCGRSVDVAIPSGAAAGDATANNGLNVGYALCAAINQQTEWPVYATVSSGGTVNVLAKHLGLRGNNTTMRADLIAGAQTVAGGAGATTPTLNGLTIQLSAAATGGVLHFTVGATEESIATALAAVASTRYDRYVLAQQGSTALAAAVAQVNSMAAVTTQLRQQVVAASVDTYANALALSTGQNAARLQLVWHYNCDRSTGEIAAQVAAARLAGDGAAGGVLVGEATDPAANLDGIRLSKIPAQISVGDQPLPTQIEAALNHGLTPLQPLANGLTAVVRSITTQYLDASSNPNYAVIDTEFVTVPDAFADERQRAFATTYAGAKLGTDSTDGTGPKIANVVTPSTVRGDIAVALKDWEAQGRIINVDAHLKDLVVVADASAPGRLLADVPVVPAPAFHQLGGNIRQLNS